MRATLALWTSLSMAAACGPEPEEVADGPHVVLVTLDTLRADRTSLHGHTQPTTPFLEELALTSTVYDHCVATAPWTVPTHASLLTGRFPFEHGARSVAPEATPGGRKDNVLPLPQQHVTLAEMLHAAGYRTAAFVSNAAFLSRRYGLAQGYDVYDVQGGRAELRNRMVLEWLASQDPGHPLHLFVNYMDTHRPYNTRRLPGFSHEDLPADSPERLDALYDAVLGRGEPAPAELVEVLQAQYDLAVAHTDRALRTLVEELRALGMWENTLLVVTSDHGEYFGEHGLVEHGKDVYEEALAVPLLLHAPGQIEGARVETRVSAAHVPRLVAAHLPPPLRARLEGLFPHTPGVGPVLAQNYYARRKDLEDPRFGARFRRVRTAWYDGDLKYVHSSDGAHELYDLSADPVEEHDLTATRPADAGRLRTALLAFLASSPHVVNPASAPEPLAPGDLEALAAMGYASTNGD